MRWDGDFRDVIVDIDPACLDDGSELPPVLRSAVVLHCVGCDRDVEYWLFDDGAIARASGPDKDPVHRRCLDCRYEFRGRVQDPCPQCRSPHHAEQSDRAKNRRLQLVSGTHVLGEVRWTDVDNFNNYGMLRPGADWPQYRPLFDEYRRLDDAVESMDVEDAGFDAAREARDAQQERFDSLHLALDDGTRRTPVHDVHPTDDEGGIYWRHRRQPRQT